MVSAETLLMMNFWQKAVLFLLEARAQKKYHPSWSKIEYHFCFQNKNLKLILKPLWVSRKGTKNQKYDQKSDFDDQKLNVLKKIQGPSSIQRHVFSFINMAKFAHLERKCVNIIKNGLIKSYKLEQDW